MKPFIQKILFVLCTCICLSASGQRERSTLLISNDADWQIIQNNNIDFLNRLLRQQHTLSGIWAGGRDNFLEQLGYTLHDYTQKQLETKAAAQRLLMKYPELNTAGCESCRRSEADVIARTDNFINHLRSLNIFDATSSFMMFEDAAGDEGEGGAGGPKCGWRFYACATACAATIEFFPAYLACCALCLCDYCKNPPKWCY